MILSDVASEDRRLGGLGRVANIGMKLRREV